MVEMSEDFLNKILRQANDMGKKGQRLLMVQIGKYDATQDGPEIVWVFDDGPETSSESWR